MTDLNDLAALAARDQGIAGAIDRLAATLEATAVARDAAGGHPAAEREAMRASGLLALSIPVEYGGLGADWGTVLRASRRLARVDSALAHLFAFHHLQVASLLLYGNAEQQARHLREAVDQRLFWGNALNPLDHRVLATPVGDHAAGGWRLDGRKGFASGSVGSDRLTVTAWHAPTQGLLIAVLPTAAPGLQVLQDWDSFGQRQTDSGTVVFDGVQVPAADVLLAPGTPQTPRQTLRPQVAQSILANLYLGLAEGALAQARTRLLDGTRPWFASGVARAVDDPFVQHRFGQWQLLLRPAQLLADAAAAQLDEAIARGETLDEAGRGRVAIAVAEAKVLAHRAAIEIGSQLFELTGASSTQRGLGLDRFWRNARVHTLHDPVDYKLRDLGRHALTGQWPEPTPYS